MDVVDGICIFCTNNNLVLWNAGKASFLQLLKIHYLDVNHINFSIFSNLFNVKNQTKSICLSCAFKIECYAQTRNACSREKKMKRSVETCSVCNSSNNVTKGSSQMKNDLLNSIKDFKRKFRFSKICLRCCFSITGFNDIKKSILYLMNLAEMSEIKSVSSNNSNSRTGQNIVTPDTTLPLRNSRRSPIGSRKWIGPSVVKESLKKVKSKIELRTHFKTVHRNMLENDISFCHHVVSDNKMMFDIPYVLCESTDYISHPKPIGTNTNSRKTRKQTRNRLSLDAISLSNDNSSVKGSPLKNLQGRSSARNSESINEDDSSLKNDLRKKLRKRSSSAPKGKAKVSKLYLRANIRVKDHSLSPPKAPIKSQRNFISKMPKIKLKCTKKNIAKGKKYTCKECNKTLDTKYVLVLHQLEHRRNYSPIISIERSDLTVLQERIRLTPIHNIAKTNVANANEFNGGNNESDVENDSEKEENVRDAEEVEVDKEFDIELDKKSDKVDSDEDDFDDESDVKIFYNNSDKVNSDVDKVDKKFDESDFDNIDKNYIKTVSVDSVETSFDTTDSDVEVDKQFSKADSDDISDKKSDKVKTEQNENSQVSESLSPSSSDNVEVTDEEDSFQSSVEEECEQADTNKVILSFTETQNTESENDDQNIYKAQKENINEAPKQTESNDITFNDSDEIALQLTDFLWNEEKLDVQNSEEIEIEDRKVIIVDDSIDYISSSDNELYTTYIKHSFTETQNTESKNDDENIDKAQKENINEDQNQTESIDIISDESEDFTLQLSPGDND